MLRPFLVFVVLAVGIHQATACTCRELLLQHRVCIDETNTTLFRGKVESVEVLGDPVNGYHRYVLKKVKVFQDEDELTPGLIWATYNNKRVYLVSRIQSASCGQNLDVGSTWLIDAYLDDNDGLLHTTNCDKNLLWPSTRKEGKLLKKLVKKPDCDCKIRECGIRDSRCIYPPHADNECIRPPYSSEPECAITYRRCRRCGGVCKWEGRSNHCETTTVGVATRNAP